MAKLHLYGDVYDRMDGPQRFHNTLSEDSILELFDLKATDTDAYDELLEESDDYFVTTLILDDPEAEESIRRSTPFYIYAEEYVFGVGYSEDSAKLAFLLAEEENS